MTSLRDVAPGAAGGGYGPSGATQTGPMRTRSSLGAEAHPEENLSTPDPDGNTEGD